ncbi:lipocalin family protein [Mesonia sp.]|uniref:lipocalin family protein n=1 Tax=Mesonia sp. TaxID=1960830 RepID=UPI003F9E119A
MKKVKLLAFLFLTLSLSSCNTDDDGGTNANTIVGLWKVDSIVFDGEIKELDGCESKNTIKFSSDETYTSTSYSDFYPQNQCEVDDIFTGTWEFISGNNYRIFEDGETTNIEIIFSDNNNKFSTTDVETDEGVEYTTTITFTRQ